MSLSVPGVSASLLDRFNAPATPLSDLLDSDSPETPETTYSFQELKQHRTMQPGEPTLDRPPQFNTDDEMVDSDIERKDNDFDIDIDAYSSAGGVDLDDVNIAMEDDFADTVPETYDNDDLMIDEEEDILFQEQQQQQQQSPVLPANTLTSHSNSDLPSPSQDTLRPQSAQTSTDAPLFSFSHHDSTPARNISFAAQEQPSVPDHSLYEDVPPENVEVTEETANAEAHPPKPDAGDLANTHKDDGPQRSQSPVKAVEEAHASSDNLLEDVAANDSVELDNDYHHHGNWSENTSTTLAHEPTLLEDQQTFEDDGDSHSNQADDVGTGIESHTPVDDFTTTGFTQYNLHPIVVQFGENRLSLFPPPPPIAEDGSIGSPINDLEFLIQDHEICEKGIDQLFQELRGVLDGVVSKDVEFVMEIEGYEVTIGEDNKSCSTFSLQDILSFHVQLHQHDGVETPEPLQINLTTRPSLANRIASLTAAVNQGIGFSQAVGSHAEGNYMKAEGERNGNDAQGQDTQPDQRGDQHIEYHNSDDEDLLEDGAAIKPEAAREAYPTLATPLAQEDNDEELVEVNETKAEHSIVEKVEEEVDDDDDFDLEYGNEEKEEAGKGKSEADDSELKADITKSPSESSSASETPKPTARPVDENSKVTTAPVQVESTTEVEEISDELSEDAQQPEEIENTPSDHIASCQEDEELIEYEEDNETAQRTTGDAEEHQLVESKESSQYFPSDQGSPQEFSEESSHYSPPDQTTPPESPHYSPSDQAIPIPPESPHVDEGQKSESPAHPSSKEPDYKLHHAESWTEANGGGAHKNENVSSDSKVPSSIPVFQGDDGTEGEYEYAEDHQQQQEYQGYGYDNQGLQFELQEGEYGEEHGETGDENDHENLQDTEYNQEGFEYTAGYSIDEQNDYLDTEGIVLQGDTVEHVAYVGDGGAYDEFEGEQEYPAEDEHGYPIEYPHEGYNRSSVTYQHERFNDVEAAADNELSTHIKEGDHGHSLSPSCAVDILDKTSAAVKETEEEQLIDYEDDEAELVQEELGKKSPSQLQKSPGDQKRMREDEPEQDGYESTGENQAKRVRSQ